MPQETRPRTGAIDVRGTVSMADIAALADKARGILSRLRGDEQQLTTEAKVDAAQVEADAKPVVAEAKTDAEKLAGEAKADVKDATKP